MTRLYPGATVAVLLFSVALLGACEQEAARQHPAQESLLTPNGHDRWKHPEIKAELQLDRTIERHSSDGGGTATLTAPDAARRAAIEAGSRERFVIEYEAGPEGIQAGGSIFLQVSPFWGWEAPQTQAEQAGGYTVVSTPAEGVILETRILGQGLMQIRIQGRNLEAGEKVRLEYGAGGAGARVDRFAEQGSRFWIAVDGNADGVRKLIAESPSVDIVARPAQRLHLALPATARPGTTVPLTIALLDSLANAGDPWVGSVELEIDGDAAGVRLPEHVEFSPADRGSKTIALQVAEEGTYRVGGVARATGSDTPGPAAMSNPLVVDAAQTGTLLWGDLQVHTQLSDGSGSSIQNLEYGRDIAGLDVIALTDHDHWGLEALDDFPALWNQQLEEVERLHEPGRFVTVPGFEWTNWVEGHRHVLFFDGSEPRLLSSIDDRYDTPAKLWKALEGENAMTIAHHSAGGPVPTDWSIAPDPFLEPITEIVSVHGSSEAPDSPQPIYKAKPGNYVRDALSRGYRLGFLGSSDGHDGHPGLAQVASGGKSGLAGIWSYSDEPRTRAGVAQALRNRTVYATSGPKIFLEAELDGMPMGTVFDAAGEDEEEGIQILELKIAAEAPIDRIDIVRGAQKLVSIRGDGRRDFSGQLEIPALQPGEWLYLRVIQRDGGSAWSSPFFVLPPENS